MSYLKSDFCFLNRRKYLKSMSSSTGLYTTVTNAGPFMVSMEHENLCVISIKTKSIATFAWWLIREFSLDRRKKNSFHSLLMVSQLKFVFGFIISIISNIVVHCIWNLLVTCNFDYVDRMMMD
jgi:hypothetical protein